MIQIYEKDGYKIFKHIFYGYKCYIHLTHWGDYMFSGPLEKGENKEMFDDLIINNTEITHDKNVDNLISNITCFIEKNKVILNK
jgi:hypothetical protein